MSTYTLTVDDFDPIITYANYEVWQTPNPQDNPTWWNATQDVTNSIWNQATYHNTTAKGPDSEASLNFTGNRIWIYGAAGVQPKFDVKIDGRTANAGGSGGSSEGRSLLFSQEVEDGKHNVSITNNGDWLVLDSIEVGMVLGASGADYKNTTLDDRDKKLKFKGDWTQQKGDNFFDQTSTYTGAKDASVTFNFTGSAVWVYGDQVNDHGLYDVFVNDTQVGTFNGRSGCGGGYAKFCEKLHGLAFFAGSLPPGEHEIKIMNNGGDSGNKTFFDLDYVEYTTPSVYYAASGGNSSGAIDSDRSEVNGSSHAATSTGGGFKPGSGSGNKSSATGLASGTGTLALVLGAYLLRLLL